MPSSARGKELAAKQKAERAALKERRKTSTNPEDWGRVRQMREVYKVTAENDKRLTPIMLGALAGPILLSIVVALLLNHFLHIGWFNVVMVIIIGVMLGLLIAILILPQRAKGAALKRYEDQAGSAEVALQMLPKGWLHKPAIAFTRHQDVVHRALGPGGVILLGEGEPGRVKALLAQEAKRHEKALFNTKVQTFQVGKKDGQIPLGQIAKQLTKLPKTMTDAQVAEANRRLTALDAVQSRLPIPKGPVPTSMKGNRSAMRGR